MKAKSSTTKKRSLFKDLLIISSFIFLIILSEGFYQLRNSTDFEYLVYLNLTKLSAKTGSVHNTFKFLGKAAEIKIKNNSNEYPEVIPPNYEIKINLPKENIGLNKSMLDYMSNLDYRTLSKSDPKSLAKAFYFLGLLAYRDGQDDLVTQFWKTSIYLAPEWSYFHIELANLYLQEGQTQKANETLDYCTQISYSKTHCLQFINNNQETNSYEEVGSFEETINEKL